MSDIRVRFAPSPTGHLHVGNFRTALFNWLFAKHSGGQFLVRIEDTDLERSDERFVKSIKQTLEWTGIKSDEPVVVQSATRDLHDRYMKQLLDEGKAYRCSCSREEILKRVGGAGGEEHLLYDGFCRDKNVSPDSSHVVRFKLPDDRKNVAFKDMVYGEITVAIEELDDFVIARSDGTPVYNFVVVVDDAEMKISHVIRGKDHISNTPKQILLYEAMGFEVPEFAHLPLIMGLSGERLSKRDAATAVVDYRDKGLLADAFCNYLARLGWSHGDQEIFTADELVEFFSLDGVGKNNAAFDPEKLLWVNSVHMREKASQLLVEVIKRDLDKDFLDKLERWNVGQVDDLVELYKSRTKTLVELAQQVGLLYAGPETYDSAAITKWVKPDTGQNLTKFLETVEPDDSFESNFLFETVKALAKELGIKVVDLAQPMRIAMTGFGESPSVFSLMEIVGKVESLERIKKFVAFLKD